MSGRRCSEVMASPMMLRFMAHVGVVLVLALVSVAAWVLAFVIGGAL